MVYILKMLRRRQHPALSSVMHMSVGFLLLAAALLPLATASDDPTISLPGVTDLTPDNFKTIHTGKKAALIEFYAPWCGHCKRLVPEYSKLGEAIASDPKLKSRVLIAKVDADAHRSLGTQFGVQGFPTIKWFPRGSPNTPEDYQGGRTMDEFLKFINEKVAGDAGFARVDALDSLAQKFYAAAEDARAGILSDAEKAAEGVAADEKDNAALYIRFMKKASEKGVDWIAKEAERLTKMSEKPMSAAKLEEVTRKISILGSFTEVNEASASKGGAADDDNDAYEDDEGADDAEDEEYEDGDEDEDDDPYE